MKANKRITTNIPTGSPLKQEYVWIPTLLSHSPFLTFSTLLSKPPLLKTCHLLSLLSLFSVFLKTPQTSLPSFVFSFSLGAKPPETSRLLPHALVFLLQSLLFGYLQKTPFLFPTSPLFQKPLKLPLLSIRTTPLSSHSALEISPSTLEPPNTFSSPISRGGQLPSHYFIIPCPLRIYMDSRWVAHLKNGPNRT